MRFRAVITLILILTIPAAGFAFDLEGVQLTLGNAVILNAEPVDVSEAPFQIESIFGFSVPMTFTDILYFEPGLRFYKTIVELTGDYKAVPAAIESLNRVSVLNCELRPEIGAIFKMNDSIDLGVTGAPVFTFRFPIKAYDEAEELGHSAIVREYYFSAARFIGIYAGGFFSWTFGEHSALRLKLGTNLPVYHIWDGDDAGFHDQLIIEPELGMVFRF